MAESTLTAEPLPTAVAHLETPPPVPAPRNVLTRYRLTVFLSAFLLFQVQLIVGKYILPLFGGTPAVWNTCMLCFQFLLLLGYGYAHLLGRALNPRSQGKIHGALLLFSAAMVAILWFKWGSPLTPGVAWRPAPEDSPVWKILELLCATVALPFFVLSATGPLLQRWYSHAVIDNSPYKLYAVSNAGSLLGLLSYPFLFEWAFTIRHQAWVWASGYMIFAAGCTAIGWQVSRKTTLELSSPGASAETVAVGEKPGVNRYVLWAALSACSTTMLLAATNLICQDLAVIPLLWVLPLCIYLVSFILSFDSHRWYRRSVFWPLYFVALGVEMKTNLFGFHLQTLSQIVLLCVALFAVCMVCHGELSSCKPPAQYLTSFYSMVAAGGVVGGIFVVLLAPRWFLGFWEFQVGLVGCGLLLFAAFVLNDPTGKANAKVWVAVLLIETTFLITNLPNLIPKFEKLTLLGRPEFVGLLIGGAFGLYWLLRRNKTTAADGPENASFPWQPVAGVLMTAVFGILVYGYVQVRASQILFRERNFYGIKSVINEPEHIALLSGSTLHGRQFKNPAARNIPLSYYRTESGIGLLLNNYPRGNFGNLRVGVIGMGAGTLVAYGHRGDYYRFYEIDPAIVALSAGRSPYFYFAHDSAAKVEAVVGDARLSLEKEAGLGERQRFDVLAVDAFSSDAIPVHLLTDEAIGIYLTHMRSTEGVLAFHVTNWHLDLAPVLAALAESHHLAACQVRNLGSTWIFLSADPEMLRLPNFAENSTALVLSRKPVLWTDGYSNLFQVLR